MLFVVVAGGSKVGRHATRLATILGLASALALLGSGVANANPILGQPCSDYDKISYDENGTQVVCGSNDSGPGAQQMWVNAGGLGGNYVPGTPCPNASQGFPFRSSDGYRVMCILADDGIAYLPGGVTLYNVTVPVWQLFSV